MLFTLLRFVLLQTLRLDGKLVNSDKALQRRICPNAKATRL